MGALIALSLRARVSRVRSGLPFMLPNAIGSREFYWCSFGERCLCSPYTITGLVIHGEQIGRTIGFPTANIEPDDANRLIPKAGVYAVKVRTEKGEVLQGMMNIGNRPTFNGEKLTLEANIFDFIGNLYNQRLTIEFHYRLRDEHHFDSPTALAKQIEIDAAKARELLNNNEQPS